MQQQDETQQQRRTQMMSLGILILVVLIVFLIVSAILMGTFNSTMSYLSSAFDFPFLKKMGMLEAMALLVLLWIVGAVLFKSMEKVVITNYTPQEKNNIV